MLSVLDIGEKNLPKVYESYQAVGTLKKSAADELGLNENVKIVIGADDNAASAIGTDTIESGDCNISLGTSGTILLQATSSTMRRTERYTHFAPRRANIIISRVFCRRQAAKMVD